MLLNLVPAPYRILVILALIAACCGGGFVYGVRHQQDQDEIAHAEQIEQAERIAVQQRAATQQHVTEYVDEIERLHHLPPAVVHDRVVDYVRGLCPAGAYPAPMPAGPTGSVEGADANAAAGRVDQLVTDAEAAEANLAQLNLCRKFVIDSGGAVP